MTNYAQSVIMRQRNECDRPPTHDNRKDTMTNDTNNGTETTEPASDGTINISITHTAMVGILVALIESGGKGRHAAIEHITAMAKALDELANAGRPANQIRD